MFKEIVVNSQHFETRIAILENHQLVELFTEKTENQLIVGNIYKGIVRNVLPGMGAAFLDIGLKRTAFLHYSDIDPNFFTEKNVKMSRDSSRIKEILSPGDEITVQVKKGPIGKKGARVTGTLTIPGKFIIFMPYQEKVAVSRKISSTKEKHRIISLLEEIKSPTTGIIIRTDAEGNSEDDFITEYKDLEKTWNLLEKQMKYAKAPHCIYEENDLSFKLIRDIFSSQIDRLVLDDKKLRQKMISRLKILDPDLISKIELYNEDSPIFDAYGIEKEIEKTFDSKVFLPSGGNITIDQTEALLAIDVNTGSFIGKNSYSDTIRQTNMEAASEIARQIRLRDLSGIMIIDFIDMTNSKHQDEVLQVLRKALKHDREKNKIYPFSPLGLVEISRKRSRPNLLVSHSERCPHCHGTGRILSRDSVAVRVSRWLQRNEFFLKKEPLTISVHSNVENFIIEHPDVIPKHIHNYEIIGNPEMNYDQFKVISKITKKDLTAKY